MRVSGWKYVLIDCLMLACMQFRRGYVHLAAPNTVCGHIATVHRQSLYHRYHYPLCPNQTKRQCGPRQELTPASPARSAFEIDFEMRHLVKMKTPYRPFKPEAHVVDIISKAHAPIPSVKVEVSDHTWIPEEDHESRGRERQEATLGSSMNPRHTLISITEEVEVRRPSKSLSFVRSSAYSFRAVLLSARFALAYISPRPQISSASVCLSILALASSPPCYLARTLRGRLTSVHEPPFPLIQRRRCARIRN